MTTGIYRLTFLDGTTYIGQSVDMEVRFEQHCKNMLKNKASEKMQYAYKHFGLPKQDFLVTCHRDHLDILEAFYINSLRPVLNTERPVSEIDSTLYKVIVENGYHNKSMVQLIMQLYAVENGFSQRIANKPVVYATEAKAWWKKLLGL